MTFKTNILVLGSTGLIGHHLKFYCDNNGVPDVVFHSRKDCDFMYIEEADQYIEGVNPRFVINLLGFNGGITFNNKCPARIFAENVYAGMNAMSVCVGNKAEKIICPLTSCGYPDGPEVYLENTYLDGRPHPSVECSGYSKRSLLIYGQQLNKQFGNKFYFPIFNNNYGSFARYKEPERLKVCDSLIKKFTDAKYKNEEKVHLFGDGSPRRELIHAYDSAASLMWMLEHYQDPEPLNIGWGQDCSIKELADLINKIVGYTGEVVWGGGPNGQMRKLLDITKMRKLGFEPTIKLEEGIDNTYHWYKTTQKYND